jgi:hypothetical protein
MRPRPISGLALVAMLAGCSPSDPIAGGCRGMFLAGQLVISEIFANPMGQDGGKEWIEIYNTGTEADLSGLAVIHSRNDGTSERRHRMAAVTLAAGDYLVIGTAEPGALPAYMDYGVGNDLGDLRNSAGRVALLCGATVVDEVTYDTTVEAASRELSGTQAPDAIANDDPERWCSARADFGDGKGTPGEANESCGSIGPPTDCLDGSSRRPLEPPEAGDLVITEWLANPSGTDDEKEWFEVLVNRDVDLNGLEIGRTPPAIEETLADDNCLRFAAGDRVLFARNAAAASNGGLPPVDFTFDFTLTNSGGSIFVGVGGNVLDQVSYATSGDGAATQLDSGKTAPADNDVPANLCAATATYGDGNKGTPRMANRSCGTIMPGDQCSDGGTPRDLVVPAVGDLVITEYMANPKAVADATGEWFEVFVARNVDLNGLQMGVDLANLRTTLNSSDCLEAAAGSYLVFARSDMASMNGGLPRVDYVFGFDLVNSNRGLVLARGGDLLDGTTYATTTEGAATSLPPSRQNASDNDSAANWCPAPAASTYGLGDRGTPGVVNPSCP